MVFNKEEVATISNILSTYSKSPKGILKAEFQAQIADQCLEKLNTLNIFTSFSKQEYTVMASAIQFKIIELLDAHHEVPASLYELRDRLFENATPEHAQYHK